MYPLGKQFEIDYTKAKCNSKALVQGQFFRISVITEPGCAFRVLSIRTICG